jgi:polyhydroxybutyrate depolymerase
MQMNRKLKKIIIGTLAIIIGLPLVFVALVVAWIFINDKTNGTVMTAGESRRYLLYVPKSYDRSKPTPLLISLHPAASWPAAEQNISRWNDLADQHGFIAVYPAGSGFPRVWPIGPHSLGVDTKYISDLIDKLESEYNIDPNSIYADGISNGGGMAFALSCRLADRIAAIGIVSAAQTMPWDWCKESRPVPTVAFHGTADPIVAYQGGSSPIAPKPFPSIRDWTARVAQRNQCKGEPQETRVAPSVRRLAYTSCAENADVTLYTIEGGGHTWPGGKPLSEWIVGRTSREISACRVMWDFFVQHRRQPK